MSYGELNPELLRRLRGVNASAGQRYIIHGIIRAVHPSGWALEGATLRRALAIELPRATAMLRLHAETGQPHPSLLQAICAAAASAVNELLYFLPANGSLNAMQAGIHRVPTELSHTGHGTPASMASAQSIASHIGPSLGTISSVVFEIFSKAWNLEYSGAADLPLLNEAIAQVAGKMVEEGRYSVNLLDDLQRDLRKSRDAKFVFESLIPKPSAYQVACVVHGVSELRGIGSLLPGARSVRLGGSEPSGWGASTDGLRKFFKKNETHRRACLALVQVEASDKGSAAARGRRVVEELLDQYIAGDRLLDLRLGDVTLAASVGRADADEFSVRGRGVVSAYPLSNDWPQELREAMRMAHLARSTESPLARAALSWVALESCGIRRRKNRDLARALSLQAFRQYVVRSYEELREAVAAERDVRARLVATEAALVTRTEKTLKFVPDDLIDRRSTLEGRLREAEANRREAQRELRDFDLSVLSNFTQVESFVGARTPDGRYLVDLDPWLTLLNPPNLCEGHYVTAARAALSGLMSGLSHPATINIEAWSHRFSQPHRCARWMEDAADRIESTLDTLYAVRNLAFHNGAFAHHGDSSLGRAGIMLIDLTLEFLGNWRKAESRLVAPDLHLKDPLLIVERLALRQQFVIAQLNASSEARKMNVTHLTGPVTNGWDRQ